MNIDGRKLVHQIGKEIVRDFNLTDLPHWETNYRDLYEYLLYQNEECPQCKLRPEKGLLMIGTVGSGKTIAMRFLQRWMHRVAGFEHRIMTIVSIQDYINIVINEGEDKALALYASDRIKELVIDDLGWEAKNMKHYTNDVVNYTANLIHKRNDIFNETGLRTHITTNLGLGSRKDKLQTKPVNAEPTILSVYGDRTYDRLAQQIQSQKWVSQESAR